MRRVRNQAAFTLMEIMIIVAIIGMLAALAMPGFIKVRKQSQARRILNDARMIDTAIDAWAMEKGRADGDAIDMAEVATYAKGGTLPTVDLLGNPFLIGTVGTNQVRISTTTKSALTGVPIDWGPY
ncbi:MAG: type II secretion system GspH family protein [Verrucomicrobiae bacterium]|nr:type II secretion system GspH family protein [Verrucomicrobiae bacterium]